MIEIIVFPSLIRRELLSNILCYPGQTRNIVEFLESLIDQKLDPESAIEIDLLKDLKLRRFSMEAISALAVKSDLISMH